MVIIGAKSSPWEQEYVSIEKGYFNFRRIRDATKNFSPANIIGQGGSGQVFKGVLPNGMAIAVKVSRDSNNRERIQKVLNQVDMLSTLRHPNLVRFLGCCEENNQFLIVYQYMENGSLASALFGPGQYLKGRLNWQTRVRICHGIAKGLAYFHEDKLKVKIVHGHIKPSNILLDEYLNPKISDFELARHYEGDNTHINTRISRTTGYMAPDYIKLGILTDKTDVYSFGVVTLELMSGMRNAPNDLSMKSGCLVNVAKHLQNKGDLLALIDEDIKTSISVTEATMVLDLAMLCIDDSPSVRPTMSEVVRILERNTTMTTLPLEPHCMTSFDSEKDMDEDVAEGEDYTLAAFQGDCVSNVKESSVDERRENVRVLIPANVATTSEPPISPISLTKKEDGVELEYVEPSFEGGKHHIECSDEELEAGYNEWKDTLVGFFLDDNDVPFNVDQETIEKLWEVQGNVTVFSKGNGYFLFQFSCVEDKIKVLESSDLWHIEQRYLVLRKLAWNLKFDKSEMKSIPVWVKIYNLPLFLWTSSFFSKIGSGLGTPLYVDQKTKSRGRLDYAKLCVEVDATKPLPESWNISVKGVDYKLALEYDWTVLRIAN